MGEGAVTAGDGMASNFPPARRGWGSVAAGLTRVFRRVLVGASSPGEPAGFLWDFGGATAMFPFENSRCGNPQAEPSCISSLDEAISPGFFRSTR